MRFTFLNLVAATSVAAIAGAPAIAQSGADGQVETPEIVSELFECREIADPQARLACFDREVARVYEAQNARELVIADREQVRETKRGLFGLKLPKLGILGGDDDADDVNELTATLVSVRKLENGRHVFTLEDGVRWLQTESVSGYQRYKVGDSIVIKKAALGSFKAKVNGKRAMRVRRLN